MQLASRIQRSLLPAAEIRQSGYVLAGWQRPATEVSGDIFDTFQLEDGRLGIAIADVAGKGLPGCLVTAMVAALLSALRDRCAGPADLLALLDERLSPKLERGTFVTMFVAFLDPGTGTLTFASAGHHPALVVRQGGGVESLSAPGLPLGTERKRGIRSTLVERTVTLEPGDLLLQTTDGIHESEHGETGEPYGFERISNGAASWAPAGPAALIDGLSRSIVEWRGEAPPLDDETIVVIGREPAHAANGADPFHAPLDRLAEAEQRGLRLRVPATLEALIRLDDWLAVVPDYVNRDGPGREHVRLALYELCANIVEHGYEGATGQVLSVWWTPDAAEAAHGGTEGHYLILDQGRAFTADNREDPDLGDPGVRRRGRGFGLALVRRTASRLAMHPGTPRGNVTLIAFGSSDRAESHGEAA
jgi:anti-sigma regulatory factor (Ser/Thr protein kinase)